MRISTAHYAFSSYLVTQTIEATKASNIRAIIATGATEAIEASFDSVEATIFSVVAIEAIEATIDAIEATIVAIEAIVAIGAVEVTLSSGASDAFRVNCFSKTATAETTVRGVTLVSNYLRIVAISNGGTIAFQFLTSETKDASEASNDKTPIRTVVFPAATLQPATLEPHQGAVIRLPNLPFSAEPFSSFLTNSSTISPASLFPSIL